MRLLVLCAAALVASGHHCLPGSSHENCTSVVLPPNVVETRGTRFKRGVVPVTQGMKDTLQVSSLVSSNLADLKIAQNFATTLFKIKPERMINALKGFSIVASVAAAFLEVPDEATVKILNKLEQGFDQLHKKMNSQTAELKAYIDYKFFNTFVVVPVKTASQQMNIYKNKSTTANKEEFLSQYNKSNLKQVMNQILVDAKDILQNVMISSRYDRDRFDRMCSTVARNFHEAYTIEFFRLGVEFKYNSTQFSNREDTLLAVFKTSRNQLSKIITDATTDFETSFFPGFIGEDIVKKALDTVGGDNCNKALNISNTLTKLFPWRSYAVIVSEETTKPSQYAHFGYDARKVVVQAYSEKSVIVYMATKNFAANKKAYVDSNERQKIMTFSQDVFKSDDLWIVTNYAKNSTKFIQMAVHFKEFNACLRPENSNVADFFDQTIERRGGPHGGIQYPLTTAVIF